MIEVPLYGRIWSTMTYSTDRRFSLYSHAPAHAMRLIKPAQGSVDGALVRCIKHTSSLHVPSFYGAIRDTLRVSSPVHATQPVLTLCARRDLY